MTRQLISVLALLLGSAFLFFAGGINALILPLRGAIEGFPTVSLGLLGTGWAVGYVSGCLMGAHLVARVGHVRSFGVMAAFAALTILAQLMIVQPTAWIILRAFSGFAFAGAAMIVESWLGERATPSTRGRIFGIYTMVNLGASTAGQLMLAVGDPLGYALFVAAAMFYILALIPTAVSSSATPQPLVSVRLDLPKLWRNSPVAVFASFMLGLANGSFGALAPVYGELIGLPVGAIALFASIPILVGAAAQIPVGILSDRIDRRKVLIGVTVLALGADAGFLLLQPVGQEANLILASVLGCAIFSMYPIIVAHANDHASDGAFIQVSGGLLLVFGLGSIVGPLAASATMAWLGPVYLFAVLAAAHALIALQAAYRIARRAPVATEDKGDFVPIPGVRATTPGTVALSATEDEVADHLEDQAARRETPA